MSQLDLRFATADAVKLTQVEAMMALETGNDGRGGRSGTAGNGSDRRNNAALAAVVDQAIRYDAERGAALAWAYLAQHGLPPETILRVLASPDGSRAPRRSAGNALDGAMYRQ